MNFPLINAEFSAVFFKKTTFHPVDSEETGGVLEFLYQDTNINQEHFVSEHCKAWPHYTRFKTPVIELQREVTTLVVYVFECICGTTVVSN